MRGSISLGLIFLCVGCGPDRGLGGDRDLGDDSGIGSDDMSVDVDLAGIGGEDLAVEDIPFAEGGSKFDLGGGDDSGACLPNQTPGNCTMPKPPNCRVAELCNNGEDDDCNGKVDDGCQCVAGDVLP